MEHNDKTTEKEEKNRRAENIEIAKKAIVYCRNIIPIESSYTHPLVTNKQDINRLFPEVKKVRTEKTKIRDAVLRTLMYRYDNYLRNMKTRTKKSKHYKVGNCAELSYIAMNYLRKTNIRCAEQMSIVKGDHEFVVIDREGDLKDPSTWGKSCIILDILNNNIFEPSEIYSKLKCYRFDINRDPPHILTDFTPNNELFVVGKINSTRNYFTNVESLNDFFGHLEAIKNACIKYLDNAQLMKLAQIIDEIKAEEYNLEELTNFEIERRLDKRIKKITDYIEGIPKSDEIFAEILANNFQSIYGLGALHHAIDFGYSQVITKLLNNGVNPYILNEFGYTPIHCATRIGNLEILQILLDHDKFYTFNYPTYDGCTPLHLATEKGHLNMVIELLKRGANPYLINHAGFLPLSFAAREGQLEILQLLLDQDRNITINHKTNEGFTLLHLAASNGRLEIVEELLKRGADPYLVSNDGSTPKNFAEEDGYPEIVRLFIDYENKMSSQPKKM